MDKTVAYQSIVNYFSVLANSGYKNYNDTYKLIVFLFIEELLNSSLSLYITEEDYRTINNVLSCIYGSSCIIPYPEYSVNTYLVQALNMNTNRLAEDGQIKFTENGQFKLLNY